MQGMLTDYNTVKEEAKDFVAYETSASEQKTFDF